jgi:hypothetical protein
MFAGAIAKSSVAPLSRMKVLFQVSESKPSLYQTFMKIYSVRYRLLLPNMFKQGGIRAFYRGNMTNCMKAGPAMGIKLLLFDTFKTWVKESMFCYW